MITILGYAIVQTAMQLFAKPLVDRLQAKHQLKQQLDIQKNQQSLNLETARFNHELAMQLQQANLEAQFQNNLQIRREQQADFVRNWSMQTNFQNTWPLFNTYEHGALFSTPNENNARPVMVFLTNPADKQLARNMGDTANLLRLFYSNDAFKPNAESALVSQVGAWKPGFDQPANINSLFDGMRLQPSVVLNPVLRGDQIDLYASCWGPFYDGSAPIQEHCVTFSIPAPNPNDPKADATARKRMAIAIACITGLYVDVHHLVENGTAPKTLYALEEYFSKSGALTDEAESLELLSFASKLISENLLPSYRAALYGLTAGGSLGDTLPNAYLNVASALAASHFADPDLANRLANEGVALWQAPKTNRLYIPRSTTESVAVVEQLATTQTDLPFVDNFYRFLALRNA